MIASHPRMLLALASCALLAPARCQSLQESPCISTGISLRNEWSAADETCHQKLSFRLWTLMKAEGSAHPDAQYVRQNCIDTNNVGLVELITPEGYAVPESLPGAVVGTTKNAITYAGVTAVTLQAFCEDDNIEQVTEVFLGTSSDGTNLATGRRLRGITTTTSEAGQAHQVAELIAGLKGLGCRRTTGEDQNVCVMSVSFNTSGNAAALQASGDLPPVDVIKEYYPGAATDRGAAMIEVMYDISSGSNYKFNTVALGEQTYADDIGVLVNEEQCDVLVDDILYFVEPAFRDGVITQAADAAVDSGSLYFSAAKDSGNGYRFKANFECTNMFERVETPACQPGAASHVFHPERTDRTRYFYQFTPLLPVEPIFVKWESEIGAAGDVVVGLWEQRVETGEFTNIGLLDFTPGGRATEGGVIQPALLEDGTVDPAFNYFLQIFHLEQEVAAFEETAFLLYKLGGLSGESDGSMFGHVCASKAVTVGAIGLSAGDGPGGAFEDPETSPVEDISGRGPCLVNGETRLKPTTAAASGLTTSNPAFNPFIGTSASAPVAAAIATIIRAACFPKVVGYDEIMEMLTDYDYTIDYTNDAGGRRETWGNEAGHGIVSARQMLAWVKANCYESCPGVCGHDVICDDPHMQGLRGQRIDWSGVDGGWYALIKDDSADLQINVRLTAPLPEDFPDRQLLTGISVVTNGHSMIIEVSNPYTVETGGCPEGVSPCLANGGLRMVVDGEETDSLLRFSRQETIADGAISVSASNLPPQCRQFGGDKIWARMYQEMLEGRRKLAGDHQSLEDWILGFEKMAAPEWCAKYIAENSLAGLQSTHAIFKIETPTVTVRLNAGVNHQGGGETDWDGRVLPDLEFWQMDVGLDGVDIENPALSGILGETARPVVDADGNVVMEGFEAFRGTVEDYRVSGAVGTRFALIDITERSHE